MPERSTPRKALLLRLDARLHAALQRLAKDEFRSLNSQIEYILREELRRRGRLRKEDER